jgi:hypothetical protein
MKDNDLLIFVGNMIEEGLAHWNVAAEIVQKPLPDQQGTPSAPTVFFERMFDLHHGSPQVGLSHITPAREFKESERQVVNTVIQISCRYRQDPLVTSTPTAPDLANMMKMFLQSRYSIAKFKAVEVAMLRVTDVRNDKFENDLHQFESFPSFDITLIHNRVFEFITPAAYSAEEEFITGV